MTVASWRLSLALAAGGLLASVPAAPQDPQLVSKVHPSLIRDTAMGVGGVVSADGRYVAFYSPGNNLVAGQVDEDEDFDVFLRDRLTGQTTLVSHVDGSPLTAAGSIGDTLAISEDGGYVLFASFATKLVAGQADTDLSADLFLWERATNTTQLVHHRAGQPTATPPAVSNLKALGLSQDGRYVLFASGASDLVAGQIDTNNGLEDLFLWDRLTRAATLVSHVPGAPTTTGFGPTPGLERTAHMSADAEYVVFESQAPNLVPGQVDEYATWEVYLFHRATGEIRLLSHPVGSPAVAREAGEPAISRDGRYVAFSSHATDLVSGHSDLNGGSDVFLYDRVAGSLSLVSHRPDLTTTTGNGSSFAPVLSADGARLAFASAAGDLAAGIQDDNSTVDVFLFERATRGVSLVSRAAGTTRTGNNESTTPALSADGRYLAFASYASDLVPGQIDANQELDVFLYDALTATLRLASHRLSSPLVAGTSLWSFSPPVLSAGGSVVLFESHVLDLTMGLAAGWMSPPDVFAYDVATEGVTSVSRRHPGLPALAARGRFFRPAASTLSDDGRYLVFASTSEDLLPGLARVQGFHLYLHDRQTGTLRLVSHRAGEMGVPFDGSALQFTISADGRFVAYEADTRTAVAGQHGPYLVKSIFLFDAATGENVLVSHSPASPVRTVNHHSTSPTVSADGRFVAFHSLATDLVAGQTDGPLSLDLFLYDRQSGTVSIVSHRTGDPTAAGTGYCIEEFCDEKVAMSRDGSFVAYESRATTLVESQVDVARTKDVFLYERATGTNRLVSRSAASAAQAGNGAAGEPTFSEDGGYLAFSSRATDHVPGQQDSNGGPDVFLYRPATGSILLASRVPSSATRTGNGASSQPDLDGNGGTVAFSSSASDLVTGLAGPRGPQLFVFEPGNGRMTLVSHRPGFPLFGGDGASGSARLSLDGRRVAYESTAIDLVPGQQDTNAGRGARDVFLYDRPTTTTLLASHVPGEEARAGERVSELPNLSADGSILAFQSQAADLASGDFNYIVSVFNGGTLSIWGIWDGWDVLVLRVNAAPIATGQTVTLREDTALAIVLAGSDADGDPLTYALASPAQHGTVSGTPPNVTYTPLPAYHGPDAFTFTVSDGRFASAPATVAIRVEPDSALAAADVAVVEGDAGTTALTFVVTATPAPTGPLTVAYQTVEGTATAGTDYLAASGALSFAAGQTSRTVVVMVNGDTQLEENETFTLQLLNPLGGDVEDGEALGGITDDDDTNCTRPPSAEITTRPTLCLNRTGAARVVDAGAGASYAWTVANGTITGGAGTATITFGANAVGTLGLSIDVTNASGCTASGSASLSVTDPCHDFYALTPCRAVDTRGAEGPALEANTVRTFAAAGLCQLPADAVAVVANVTATAQTERGNLRLFPSGGPVPPTSVLNFVPFKPRAGMAAVSLGSDGRVSVRCDMAPGSTGQTHFILDVYGYFR